MTYYQDSDENDNRRHSLTDGAESRGSQGIWLTIRIYISETSSDSHAGQSRYEGRYVHVSYEETVHGSEQGTGYDSCHHCEYHIIRVRHQDAACDNTGYGYQGTYGQVDSACHDDESHTDCNNTIDRNLSQNVDYVGGGTEGRGNCCKKYPHRYQYQ